MRILLIHNPKAGDRNHSKKQLMSRLRKYGLQAFYQSIKECGWKQAFKKPVDVVIAAGGDGTVHKTAWEIMDSGIPLAILPLGTANIGLAVQTPMKSFIAWIYILVRQPFRVGDRIKIGDATGDVIDVGYLDTTLWEFGGQYLSTDHPSGRLIKFPNEKVLDEIIYNYSWPLFPYIWNEVKFQVAYNADLEFIAKTMQKITEEELGHEMLKRVETFRDLLARTPVDELDVH